LDSVGGNRAGTDSKFSANANQSSDGLNATVVVSPKSALIKSNGGQSTAVRIGPDSFIESTAAGRKVLWTLLSSSGGTRYLISMKAYTLVEPSTFTSFFECK
jgi:hypothetical protein